MPQKYSATKSMTDLLCFFRRTCFEKPRMYVQSATLNGKRHNQAWFRHDNIKGRATPVLTM